MRLPAHGLETASDVEYVAVEGQRRNRVNRIHRPGPDHVLHVADAWIPRVHGAVGAQMGNVVMRLPLHRGEVAADEPASVPVRDHGMDDAVDTREVWSQRPTHALDRDPAPRCRADVGERAREIEDVSDTGDRSDLAVRAPEVRLHNLRVSRGDSENQDDDSSKVAANHTGPQGA